MSWSNILLVIWMAMFAIFALTNVTIAAASIIHGVVALCLAVCLCFGK